MTGFSATDEARKLLTGSSVTGSKNLTADEWDTFLSIAVVKSYRVDEFVLCQGRPVRGLLQVVKGEVSARITITGRPQALVVGKNSIGDFIGEMSYLISTDATAE